MQGARRRPWWLPRASRATPQTPLSLPTLRDRADFPSCGVVASLLGIDPTASAPPCLRGNLPRSRPRGILRQAPYPAQDTGTPPISLLRCCLGCDVTDVKCPCAKRDVVQRIPDTRKKFSSRTVTSFR